MSLFAFVVSYFIVWLVLALPVAIVASALSKPSESKATFLVSVTFMSLLILGMMPWDNL